MFKFIFIIIFLFSFSAKAQTSTKGTEFWLGYMENLATAFNYSPSFSLVISSEYTTTGTISVPRTGFSINFSAIANTAVEIPLPQAIYYSSGSDVRGNLGIKIASVLPIQVYAMHYRLFFSESTIVLPINELGNNYMIMANRDHYASNPSEIVIVGTQDNTEVEVIPSTLTNGLRPAGLPYTIILNKGETFQIQAPGDLTGTILNSSNAIAVFSGATRATTKVGCNSDSHLYDQNYPLRNWGRIYCIVPFKDTGGDIIKIISSENNSLIKSNCSNSAILSKGQYYELETNQPQIITSNHPICLAQFSKSGDCHSDLNGDPSMLIHPAFTQFSKSVSWIASAYVNNANSHTHFSKHYVNIVTLANSTNRLSLDGSDMSASFIPFPSHPEFSYAQLAISAGEHTIRSDSGFYAFAYGSGPWDTYTQHLGYEYINPNDQNVTIDAWSKSFCVGTEIEFRPVGGNNFSNWNWSFGDGMMAPGPGVKHIFNKEGAYKVSLTFTDNNNCFYTVEKEILIQDCCDKLFVPNLFTPNGDEYNEDFKPSILCNNDLVYKFEIYNRWGTLVFRTENRSEGWNGKNCSDGVYFWILNFGDKIEKGYVTIIR